MVLALVKGVTFTPLPQRDDRDEKAMSRLGEDVLATFSRGCNLLDQYAAFGQSTEAVGQDVPGDAETPVELGKGTRPVERIADDQQTPFVPDHIDRPGHGAQGIGPVGTSHPGAGGGVFGHFHRSPMSCDLKLVCTSLKRLPFATDWIVVNLDPVTSRSFPIWLRLILAALCAVSVANIYYAQPLLETIGADLGIPIASLGMVVAVGQIGYLTGLVALVPLGDWMNRRVLIAAHIGLAASGTLTIGLSRNLPILLVGVAIAGIFSVVVQIVVAYTAAASIPAERGRNIGTVTSGVVIGIILARTVAGAVADLAGWRSVYLTSTIVSLVLASIALKFLPRDARRRTPSTYATAVVSVFVLTATDRVFRTRALVAAALFASFGVLWSGISLPLSQGPWQLSATQIGMFGFAGLAGAMGAIRAGRWADQGIAAPVTAGSLALLIVSWGFIGYADSSLWMLVIGVILLDFAVQAVHVTSQSLIVAGMPESAGRVIGSYMVYYSIGSAWGAISATWLYERAGWGWTSALGAIYAAVALAIWALDQVVPSSRTSPDRAIPVDVR